jgi:ubiquinone/menaquinone biosynthesis C-methylase UbiE
MKQLLNIITPLHKKTARDYVGRMTDDKIGCMKVARRYGRDFWDGDRRYGYGGFKYDGRYEPVARKLIEAYGLKPGARILDVGCGKGFVLYELSRLLPESEVKGFDMSEYAIQNAKAEIRDRLFVHKAQDPYPFADKSFDLVISMATVYNLQIFHLKSALKEIERVGKNKYVTVESYRNEAELFNPQCWALTCQSFHTPDEWVWLYNEFGYTGDYEFMFFE